MDLSGPATCFGLDNLQADSEVLGFCGIGNGYAVPDEARQHACPQGTAPPTCNRRDAGPRVDASEQAADASEPTDGAIGSDAGEGSPDGAVDGGADGGSRDGGSSVDAGGDGGSDGAVADSGSAMDSGAEDGGGA